MFLIALRSLSDVAVLPAEFISLSAVNCKADGMIILRAFAATFRPLSSSNAAMSIIDCSKDVSLRSAAVASSFLWLPEVVG